MIAHHRQDQWQRLDKVVVWFIGTGLGFADIADIVGALLGGSGDVASSPPQLNKGSEMMSKMENTNELRIFASRI